MLLIADFFEDSISCSIMVSAIGVGGGIAVRTVVVGRGNIGPVSVESVVGVSQTMVAKGAVVGISISISISRPLAEMPVGTIVVGVGGGVAKRPGVGRGNIGPESVVSVVGVSQTMVAKGAVVSISISISLGLRLSISRPLAKVPVGTIVVGVGRGVAKRPGVGRGNIGPVSIVSVVGISKTMVAKGAVVSISISLGLGLSISRPLAKVPVGTIGVGTGISIRPDAKGIRGSIGPQSVVGVSQTMVAEGAVVGISIGIGLSVASSHKSSNEED